MPRIKNNFKTFLGKKLLFFTAHPDDESYVTGGTIYKNHQFGGKNFLICASNGEQGISHLKNPLSVQQLKKVRQEELLKTARFLHIAPVIFLNLPDGMLKRNSDKIFGRGLSWVKKLRPEAIISFGSDGISGHLDHITVGKTARLIAKRLQIPFFTATLPPWVAREASQWLKSRRKSGRYLKTIAFKKPDLKISIDLIVKRKALRIHRSQMDNKNAFTGFPQYAVKELLKAEYFVRG